MESDKRKRKIMENFEEQDKGKEDKEKEEEEKKMEKFFDLVRNARELRDLMRRGSSSKDTEEKKAAVWNPSFQPEDFMQKDSKLEEAAPSKKEAQDDEEEEHKKGGGDNGIDLNLSL